MVRPVFAFVTKRQSQMLSGAGAFDQLISYYYLKSKKPSPREFIEDIRQNCDSTSIFMLDSGAFSAWAHGIQINIWDYIDFISEHADLFTHIVALDVIDNPYLSEVNHVVMLTALRQHIDCPLIPVFHSGEPLAFLRRMIDKGYGYIGLSPNNNWKEYSKRQWLERIMPIIKLSNVRTHGFGYGSTTGLNRYPMTTADTTTWITAAGFGNIILPGGQLGVSQRRGLSTRITTASKHIDERQSFINNICRTIGVSCNELTTDRAARARFNIEAILHISESRAEYTFSLPTSLDLFDDQENMSSAFGYCDDYDGSKLDNMIQSAIQQERSYRGYEVQV